MRIHAEYPPSNKETEQKDWGMEAERVLEEFTKENEHLEKSAKGIIGQNLMAKIAGEISKVEVEDPDSAKTFAQQLLIELDRSSSLKTHKDDATGDVARQYLEDYLHPEEQKEAA